MKKKIYIILRLKIIIIILNINLFHKYDNMTKLKKNLYKNNLLSPKNTYGFFNFDKLNFNISLIKIAFSFKYNTAKIEYNIAIFDEKNELKIPSYLTLLNKLHIFCYIIEINSNIKIKFIANILENKFYNCINFINIKQKYKFGIIIYKNNKYIELFSKYIFLHNIIDYNNNFLNNDEEFDPLIHIKKYNEFNINLKYNYQNNNESILLKKSFYLLPKLSLNYILFLQENNWDFINIYNNYFCLCYYLNDSECLYKTIKKKCKYKLFLNIIDNNRNLYKKTDYLFADFSSINTATCDAYLVFKEMIKQNLNVHYMSKREDVYEIYKNFKTNIKVPIIFDNAFINGDFLEKYLDIFLRLKAVISGAKIYSIDNLFYNIDYITYISLGHGISLLKDFLYKDYYSNKIYNKIVLPPSKIIILNAKKFGWKEKNIIKIGLPRWDILTINENDSFFLNSTELNNNSIFAMFSWRNLKNNQMISKHYLKNIFKLINNQTLNKVLKENNITFYYSLHHMIEYYKIIFQINKHIIYINQEKITECLLKSNLIISDFSSIIFDIMVKNKPYIIYIPDANDPNLDNIYDEYYYKLINDLKNGNIKFLNRFFNINETINKIIYYIVNKFKLEENMQKFYKKFNLNGHNNTKKFIEYLTNLN